MPGAASWQHSLDVLTRRHGVLMTLIAERSRLDSGSRRYVEKTQELKGQLAAFSRDLTALAREAEADNPGVTKGERRRRLTQVEVLRAKERQLTEVFQRKETSRDEANRELLLEGRGFSDLGALGWTDHEDHVGLSEQQATSATADLKQEQEDILRAQDEGLESLHHVISRQRLLAEAIGGEARQQNELLDEIGDTMDQTTQRLIDTTTSVRSVGRRNRTCGYWVAIIVLLILIIIVSVLPH